MPQIDDPHEHADVRASTRVLVGARLLVLSGGLIAIVGFISGPLGLVALTTSVGPTAYLLLAHPHSTTARLPNAVLGHAAAIGCGLAALALFGLWRHPSVVVTSQVTPAQAGAQALAVGCTLFLLVALRAHHAPAAATALLVSSGISHPGRPLAGLAVGLAVTLALAPLLAHLPPLREATAAEERDVGRSGTPRG